MNPLKEALDGLQALPTPKVISPKTHAILDYATVAGFGVAAGILWDRNRRAGVAALINGAFVLGYSLFTDYPLAIRRSIPLPVHGQLDIVQAGMAEAMPAIFGFGDAAALFFRAQGGNEGLVVSMTDFYRRKQRGMRRAA